jgi:hypothetical protein
MAMLSMVKEHDAYSSTEARWKRRFHSGIARAGSPVMVTFLTGGSSSSGHQPALHILCQQSWQQPWVH